MALCERLALALRNVCSRACRSVRAWVFNSVFFMIKRAAPGSPPTALWARSEGSVVGEGSGAGLPAPEVFDSIGHLLVPYSYSPRDRGEWYCGGSAQWLYLP